MGTPSYMPPEQAVGDLAEIDESSDIFGLGAILYYILTDLPPYTGEDIHNVLAKAANRELTRPRQRSQFLNFALSSLPGRLR